MPFSSGTYSLPSGNPVVTGTTISSSTTNTTNSDIATALSSCILKDGTQTVTANIPMASHKITGLIAGSATGDSARYDELILKAPLASPTFTGTTTAADLAYTGTLTGSTGILNIGSGQVYKDASGNVGIGTSSPGARLDVRTTSSTQATFTRTGQTAVCTLYQSTADTYLSATNSGANLILATQDTERMRLDSSGNLLFNSGYGSVATAYGCRAWVNFNGTGTVAIRASGNVSSITDTGVGGYTVNFTTAMPDANYAVTGLCSDISVNGAMVNTTTLSTSGVTIATRVPAAYLGSDQALITIAINR